MKTDIWIHERKKAEIEPITGIKILKGQTFAGLPTLTAWNPKAIKPFVNCRFTNIERMEKYLNTIIEIHIEHQKSKERYKQERKATPERMSKLKCGDIFYYSWGYDQTNIDWYQVTDIKGQYITLTPIKGQSTQKDGYSSMSAFTIPVKNCFSDREKTLRKKVYFYNNEPCVSMSFGSCSLWDGKEKYYSWYA